MLRGRAVDELNTLIYKCFNDAGIEIPFPQRDVHMRDSGPATTPPEKNNDSNPG
jgi:small-conductance mechanosensitive channel